VAARKLPGYVVLLMVVAALAEHGAREAIAWLERLRRAAPAGPLRAATDETLRKVGAVPPADP
jgi:hypothetical protein